MSVPGRARWKPSQHQFALRARWELGFGRGPAYLYIAQLPRTHLGSGLPMLVDMEAGTREVPAAGAGRKESG